MNQQPTKRRNPFDVPREVNKEEEVSYQSNASEEAIINDDIESNDNIVNETPAIVQQQPVQQQYVQQPQYYEPKTIHQQPVQQPIQQQRVVRNSNKQRYTAIEEVSRDKFTSTMDKTLRRNIKIVCAQRGIMFAQFVEDACREKLAKEGYR